MTTSKIKFREIDTTGQKIKELVSISGAIAAVMLLAWFFLATCGLRVEPTPQQEEALFEEANRRLNETGLVHEYQLGRRIP